MYGLSANRIAMIAAMPKWGGGIHKDHLEYLLGVPSARHKDFERALMIAYARGQIQFCRGYVCAPPRAR